MNLLLYMYLKLKNNLFFLFQLFRQGKLDGEKLAKLKSMYTAHHDLLQGTRESESTLLSRAKDLHQEVEKQRSELEKADNFPEGEVTEVSRLRQDLLKHSNELAQADERQYQLDFILNGLREERTMLEREYSRMPKEEEIEKEVKDLKKFIEEMKVEIAKRNQETKTLKDEMETRDWEVRQLQNEFEKSSYEEQTLKSQLLEVHLQPAHLLKQVDLMSRQLK
jgi:chromosome segregation ATPase